MTDSVIASDESVSHNPVLTRFEPHAPALARGVVSNPTEETNQTGQRLSPGRLVSSGSEGDGDRIESEAEQVHIDSLALKVEKDKAEADAIPPCSGCGRTHWTPDIKKERHAVKAGSPLTNRICFNCPGPAKEGVSDE